MKQSKEKIYHETWIMRNLKSILLSFFTIILPLIIALLLFLNYTKKGNSFYFETKDDKPVILYQENLSKEQDYEQYFDFDIELTSFEYEENGKTKGKYNFKKTFKPKGKYEEHDFSFEYILISKWKLNRSDVKDTHQSSFYIDYNYNLSKHHLVFLVGKPILYIKIKLKTQTTTIGDLPAGEREIFFYLKYDLNKVEYKNIKEKTN